MYIPKHFAEPRTEVLHELMQTHPLATLVSWTGSGIEANHIPLYLSVPQGGSGVLRGHVARANPVWSDTAMDVDVLAIFHGPEAYVTPTWYPTKTETGKAVPTWNYAVAHAYGKLTVIDDAVWLRHHLDALTAQHERTFAVPWQVSDAPRDYIEKMMGAVMGIEIAITRLAGKWKVSQNQPLENRLGVVEGLRKREHASSRAVADLVEQRTAKS